SALASTLAQADRRYEIDPPLVTTAGPSGQQEDLLLALAHLYTHGIDPHWPIPDTSTPVPLPLRSWNHDHVDPSTATIVRLQDLDIERIEQVIEDQVIRTVRELTART